MLYKLEYENGLSRVIYSRESSFLNLKFHGINEEGLRSIATIPEKWDTSEDLQIRDDGIYENIHLTRYPFKIVKSSTEKQNE